jgi:PBSX family phage terminase large subunit
MLETYFKIPIDKLASKLPDKYGFKEFNPSQEAMVNGLSERRFWVHISARRTGKSSAAAVLAFAKLLEPNQQVLVVAPNFNLSSIIWDYTSDLIDSFGIETKRNNAKDHVVELINGSTFRLLSAENRTSLVGRAANLLIVDEAALIPTDEYFTRDLRPALSTFPDSRALFISTPRGTENYLYEYYTRGQSQKYPDWGSGLFPWHANPRLQQKDIDEARATLPENIFLQEYYCKFDTFEGQIYKLSDENHCIDLVSDNAPFKINPNDDRFTFIAGLDMGYRDETAFIVMATDDVNFYVVDEYYSNESATSVHAEKFRELIERWNIQNIYIDSAAAQTKADLAYDYDIYCDNAVKSVTDGIAALQSLIVQNKLLLDKNTCERTISSIKGYRWNNRTEKVKPMHDKHSHGCDATRYAIYSYLKASAVDIYIK